MIFHFMGAQKLVADLEHYVIDFDMIFHITAAQNMVAEHYEIDIDMIFHITAAQNTVAEHYERDFDRIFHFMQLKTWLQSTV